MGSKCWLTGAPDEEHRSYLALALDVHRSPLLEPELVLEPLVCTRSDLDLTGNPALSRNYGNVATASPP